MFETTIDTTELDQLEGMILNDEDQEFIKDLFKADPKLWRVHGDLNNLIRQPALECLAGDSVERYSVMEGLRQMKLSLMSEGSTPLELIAIDQIINNHLQVLSSGRQLEMFEPDEENAAASKHWLRVHNAAQARLIKAVNWLTRLRKLKVDDVIKRNQNRYTNFESEFAKSLKNIDKQMDVLERLENGEELTDEELGIPTQEPKARSKMLEEMRDYLANHKLGESDAPQEEESSTEGNHSVDRTTKAVPSQRDPNSV